MSKKTITITFSDTTIDQISKLKEKWGMFSNAETIRNAISQTYSKEFRDYIPASRNMTVGEKAKSKVDMEIAKEDERKEREAQALKEKIKSGKNYCRMIGGKELKPDGSGIGLCEYKMIDYINPNNASIYTRKMYFDELDTNHEEVIQKQFYNSNTNEVVPKEVAIEGLKNCGETWID